MASAGAAFAAYVVPLVAQKLTTTCGAVGGLAVKENVKIGIVFP